MFGDLSLYLQNDAQVIWDRGQVRIIDPNGLMHDVTITLSEDPDDPAKKTATLTVTFSESMGMTNMVVRTWNTAGQITTVRIFDALDVTESATGVVDPEPISEPVPAVDPEPGSVDPEPVAAPEPEPPATVQKQTAEPGSAAEESLKAWAGFASGAVSDAELLASLGLDYPGAQIPDWVMTNLGPLVVKGQVTLDEFTTALEYVLENA